MPRKNITTIDVNQCRAENYAEHFQRRQIARIHPDRENIAKLVAMLPKPMLNVYGVVAFEGKVNWPTSSHYFQAYFEIGKKLGFDLDFEYWYWSDEGWRDFEKLWAELPDFVHRQVCTTDGVIHISTQDSYSYPTEPK